MNAVTGLVIACIALSVYGLPSSQIVGGVDAPDGLYPYQVSLKDRDGYFCSGAIISNQYIITTAQCLIRKISNPYDVFVGMGSNYLNESTVSTESTRAKAIIVHAGYNEALHLHDIALIHVDVIKFNDNIKPIPLSTDDRNYDGYPLVVTGWGSTGKNSPISNRLQEIIVKGYSQEKCSTIHKEVKNTHLCISSPLYGRLCDGDVGNPVVADGVLVGLAFVGNNPCNWLYGPDVATRIFHYRTWINYYTMI